MRDNDYKTVDTVAGSTHANRLSARVSGVFSSPSISVFATITFGQEASLWQNSSFNVVISRGDFAVFDTAG
jgi:hypothetical protein